MASAAGAQTGGDVGSGVGGLVGGIAVLAGAAGKGGRRDVNNALDAWRNLELSNFDYSALSPPELQLIGEYFPETYDAIVPEEFKQVERPETYAQERQALSQLQELADTGEADIDRIQRLELADDVAGIQARGREDALRDLGRRGQLGGGDALRARLSSNAAASDAAAQMGRGVIADRAGRRADAVRDYAAYAGDVSGRDLGREYQNQQAQNRYSELWANLQTDAARFGAQERGAAQASNLARARTVGDTNALNRYQNELANLERKNALRSEEFGQRLAKTGGTAQGYLTRADLKERERQQKAAAYYGIGSGLGGAGGAAIGGGALS